MILSVVIPTCHRNDHLAECLSRLAPGVQTLAATEYDVTVTDDGSASTAEQMVKTRFPWVRWTQGPRRGPAANRNHGASLVTNTWIVFGDDDVLPTPGWLAAYRDAFAAHPDVTVFEGKTSADRPRRHPLESAPINPEGGFLWSCNLAIATATFRRVGGFNEQFPFAAMEDMDFAKRLRQAGIASRFVGAAEIVHPWRMQDFKRHTRRHVASQLIYARLHPDDRQLFTFTRHCKTTARYYLNDFPSELRQFGWATVKMQPLRIWEAFYRGWFSVFGK